MIYRRLLAFFLSFALIFSSTSALATTSVGGWTAVDTLIAGSNTTINAVKGAGATGMRSAVTVAASAGKVGKHLIKGGGSVALAFAMVELADGAIDWVLDPANNRVKYTKSSDDGSVTSSSSMIYDIDGATGSSPTAACSSYISRSNATDTKGYSYFFKSNTASLCYFTVYLNGAFFRDLSVPITSKNNPAYNPSAPTTQEKYLPIDVVAAKVIANAEAGHAPSQEAVKAVALEGFAAGEHDAALDAAAVPDTGVENPTDPVDPAKPVDLSPITAAINALKAILSGILSSITSLTDWFKGEPEANKPEDNKIDIPEVPLPDIDSSVSFGGSCPDDLGADFNLYGTNFNFVLMPFSKLCPLLSTFIKPTLILLGSFMAVAIVGGRKDA